MSFQRSSRQYVEGPPAPEKKIRSIGSTADQVWRFQLAACVFKAVGHSAHLFPGPTDLNPCPVSTAVTNNILLATGKRIHSGKDDSHGSQ